MSDFDTSPLMALTRRKSLHPTIRRVENSLSQESLPRCPMDSSSDDLKGELYARCSILFKNFANDKFLPSIYQRDDQGIFTFSPIPAEFQVDSAEDSKNTFEDRHKKLNEELIKWSKFLYWDWRKGLAPDHPLDSLIDQIYRLFGQFAGEQSPMLLSEWGQDFIIESLVHAVDSCWEIPSFLIPALSTSLKRTPKSDEILLQLAHCERFILNEGTLHFKVLADLLSFGYGKSRVSKELLFIDLDGDAGLGFNPGVVKEFLNTLTEDHQSRYQRTSAYRCPTLSTIVDTPVVGTDTTRPSTLYEVFFHWVCHHETPIIQDSF